jgi:hypothetical protein
VGSKEPDFRADVSGRESEIRPVPSDVIDVITIGDEATVFKSVQRPLIGSGWVVRHADTVHSPGILLDTNKAAVAVVEADDACIHRLSSLRSLQNAPEVVVITDGSRRRLCSQSWRSRSP